MSNLGSPINYSYSMKLLVFVWHISFLTIARGYVYQKNKEIYPSASIQSSPMALLQITIL